MKAIERNIERTLERLEMFKDSESQEFYKAQLERLQQALDKLKQ